MNPEQILEAMAEVYATCLTYRDTGQVRTRFYSAGRLRPRTSVRPFHTAFCRPDRFRFEFRERYEVEDEWDQYIVWSNGPVVRTWWDIQPAVEQPESLGLALAGATGVSGGSAHTIPALLLPDRVSGRRLTELIELVSLGDAQLGEVVCYRLSGPTQPHLVDPAAEERHAQEVLAHTGRRPERAEQSPTTLWIDRGTMLVRRIEGAVQFETFRTEEVTEYEPAVGVELGERELLFGAPQQADPVATEPNK